MEKKQNWQEFEKVLKEGRITKLYHFTDFDNLESIIKNGGLYSWADCRDKGIKIPKPGSSGPSRSLMNVTIWSIMSDLVLLKIIR